MPCRVSVSLPEGLFDRVQAYADLMGLSLSEACRHLVIKGVEQVQALSNARDSVDALNRLTAAFDRGIQEEETLRKKASSEKVKKISGRPRKPAQGLVTPAQSVKNGTRSEIKDIFK